MGRWNVTSNLFGITLFTGEVVFTSKKEYCSVLMIFTISCSFGGFCSKSG